MVIELISLEWTFFARSYRYDLMDSVIGRNEVRGGKVLKTMSGGEQTFSS